MKNALVLVTICLFSIIIVIFSYFIYQDKLKTTKKNATKVELVTSNQKESAKDLDEKSAESDEKNSEKASELLDDLLKNLPANAQTLIKERAESGKQVKLLITGSNSTASYADALKEAIEATYGEVFNVTIMPFTSNSALFRDVMASEIDWETGYDLILFEAFTLNNVGAVEFDTEVALIEEFNQLAKEANPESIVFIQADFPNATKEGYHEKVAALEDELAEQDIPFVDHWQDWDLAADYYSTEGTLSEAGQEIWQSYLIHYFTGE